MSIAVAHLVGRRERGGRARFDADGRAAGLAEPPGAILRLGQHGRVRSAPSGRPGHGLPHAAIESMQTGGVARPDAGTFLEHELVIAGGEARRLEVDEPIDFGRPSLHRKRGDGDHGAGGVRHEAEHEFRWPAALRAPGLEASLAIPGDAAALGAQPQIALGVLVERRETVAEDPRGGALVEDGEADAVEPREAIERGHPQIPVAGLVDGRDDVLRQPVVDGPHVEAVLRRGVDGHDGERQHGERQRPERGCQPVDGRAPPRAQVVRHRVSAVAKTAAEGAWRCRSGPRRAAASTTARARAWGSPPARRRTHPWRTATGPVRDEAIRLVSDDPW